VARRHPGRHRRRQQRAARQPGRQQPGRRRPDDRHAADDGGARHRRHAQRHQQAQREVLELVDVGHHAAEQLAVAPGLQARRRQRLDPLEDAGAHPAERPEGEVVGAKPFEVARQRARQREPADGHDDHRQREDRRLLGRPADQVAGEADQRGAAGHRERAEPDRSGQARRPQAEQPGQPPQFAHRVPHRRRPPSSRTWRSAVAASAASWVISTTV
jgi:hypothetical protein